MNPSKRPRRRPALSAGPLYEWRVTRPKPNFAELSAGSGPRRCTIFGCERQCPLSFTIAVGSRMRRCIARGGNAESKLSRLGYAGSDTGGGSTRKGEELLPEMAQAARRIAQFGEPGSGPGQRRTVEIAARETPGHHRDFGAPVRCQPTVNISERITSSVRQVRIAKAGSTSRASSVGRLGLVTHQKPFPENLRPS
jgi:hypothetical protein